jgi:hypothetical protein
MVYETPFADIVLFSVAGDDARSLCDRLYADRPVWLHIRDGEQLVVASLQDDPADLALLLRAVEEWIASRRREFVDFELDGTRWTLPASRAIVSFAA